MGLDLSTKAGALRFAELRRAEMQGYYLKHGALEKSPFFYMFATHGFTIPENRRDLPRTGKKLPEVTAWATPVPRAMREKLEWRDVTLVMGDLLKEAAKVTKAVGVLVMMDSWIARADLTPEDGHYGWIEERPDKLEALYMGLEHVTLVQPMRWMSLITRDPLKLEPWTLSGAVTHEGDRLANFIDWRS